MRVMPPSEAKISGTISRVACRARRRARHATLLIVPEIFASEGGITRMLQIYLKALCELAEPDGTIRLAALNDAVLDSGDLRRSANDRLDDWEVCRRSKSR